MFAKLFRSRPSVKPSPVGSIPDDQRIYAIGDIHGRLDLLTDLIARIEADEAERGPAETSVIFLGDLIDRGPESSQVVEYLRRFAESRPAGTTRFLQGNHEEVFLAALSGDQEVLRFFLRIGGRETILSYGIDEDLYAELDYPELLEALQARVPAEHVEFLNGFEDLIVLGDYAFVHAGVRPGTPLAAQKVKDLRWIRDSFLNHDGAFEKIVVHGHSITAEVEETHSRIGIDTGAFASGRLTAMAFERDRRWVLQTAAGDD